MAHILEEYLPKGKVIDVMDVDVEGMDLQVLQSNNWNKYRPQYVLAESIGSNLEECSNEPIVLFMKSVGYRMILKLVGTMVFEKEK